VESAEGRGWFSRNFYAGGRRKVCTGCNHKGGRGALWVRRGRRFGQGQDMEERTFKVFTERMGNVKRQQLKRPLLRSHCVISLLEAGSWWAEFGPLPVCMGGHVEGGGQGNVMGCHCRGVEKVVCQNWSWCKGGIPGSKRRAAAKGPIPPKWSPVNGTSAIAVEGVKCLNDSFYG
jgi:hypothetical protein